jgi:hypothetical protein
MNWIRSKIAVKLGVFLALVAIPVMAAGVGLVVMNEHAAVKDLVIRKGRIAALMGARQIGIALDRGISSGAFTMEDVVAPKYEEITFPFPVKAKRYHLLGTAPATDKDKSIVRIDEWTDRDGWAAFEDSCLEGDSDFIYCSAMDANTYVPSPHARYGERPNGNKEHDLVSRWKQKYNQPLHFTAVAYEGTEPLVQEYHRDTGEMVWDIAAPITVKGQHWGAFRVGVLQKEVASRGKALALALVVIFGVTLVILLLCTFWLLQRSMKPLVALTGITQRLCEGYDEELRTPLRSTAPDEVGQMTRALNGLRNCIRMLMLRDEEVKRGP